jgi:type II secretory pathway pseudopilin PulG
VKRSKYTKQVQSTLPNSTGFSLIEIAVVLAVAAAIGLAIWQFLPSLRRSADGDPAGEALLLAQQALDGFIITNHRLPCPAAGSLAGGSTGEEDCGITSGVGVLPYRTLGLAKSAGQPNLRYGVFRQPNLAIPSNDADLATAPVRYLPYLPTLSPPIGVFLPSANGLDFCVGLTRAIASPSATVPLRADTLPVAYAIAHAGANGTYDGANATTTDFSLAAKPSTAIYDDRVITAGLSELFGRLNCPERLGQANGAARSAYAAYDVARTSEEYFAFCKFFYEIAGYDVAFATIGLTLATINLATTVVQGLIGIGLGLADFGVSFILTGPMVLLNGTLAGIGEGLAIAGLDSAVKALKSAEQQRDAADTFNANAQAQARTAYLAAIATRQKGLLP